MSLMKRILFLTLTLATLGVVTAQAGTDQPEAKPPEFPPFSLTFSVPEARIYEGKLQTEIVAKRFDLKAQWVARSRHIGRLSTKLTPDLDGIFERLDAREAKNARFVNEGGRWVGRQQSGWTVDREATKQKLLAAIRNGAGEAEIVVNVTPPGDGVDKLAQGGILYHFGSGQSSYRGSPSFRETNILVGARKFDGKLLADGDELDFNATVGDINGKSGFVPGYIISGNTLAKEDGGGLCQVSTTMFRAAYESGLPITERKQHSYRVHYYDPVGYEATVYAPYKNLKFKNDTGAGLLIQATWDREKQTLRFDLFGARPEREVKISDPVVSDFRPPAPPTYMPDVRVALGHARLIDSPEQGMTAVITRQVHYPDGRDVQDITRSVYKPWGAVYGVNPQDPRVQSASR